MCVADHVVAADLGVTAVRAQQGGQDPHRGGLARAVRAQQAEYRAASHGEVDPVQGDGPVEPLDQPFGNY